MSKECIICGEEATETYKADSFCSECLRWVWKTERTNPFTTRTFS